MTTITPLPDPPLRSSPADFAEKGDAFMAALPTFATETNTVASEVNGYRTDTVNSVNLAIANGLASAATNAATATAAAQASEAARDESVASWTAALAANPDLNPAVRMNPSTIQTDTTIPTGYNAYSASPLMLAEGTTVTIQDNANWSII